MEMSKSEKLTQLVEQAACCINMLSPTDLSDAQQLEDLFSQILRAIKWFGRLVRIVPRRREVADS